MTKFYPPTIIARIKLNLSSNLPNQSPFTSETEMALTDLYCLGMLLNFIRSGDTESTAY